MRTPAGAECRYYYEDYYRGHETRECRLIARNPRSLAWEPRLCKGCPVPAITRANFRSEMALEASVVRRLHFWKKVTVEAFCLKHLTPIPDPFVGCQRCFEERGGAAVFDLPVAPESDDDPK